MFPTMPVNYVPDAAPRYSVSTRLCSVAYASTRVAAYLLYGFLSEFSLCVTFAFCAATVPDHVGSVVPSVAVFEVIAPVIAGIAVNVTDTRLSGGAFSEECKRHDSMKIALHAATGNAKRHVDIPTFSAIPSKHLGFFASPPAKTQYSSVVRNTIQAFEANYVAPDFLIGSHRISLVMGADSPQGGKLSAPDCPSRAGATRNEVKLAHTGADVNRRERKCL